ncbi:MAG: pyrroline-5-carboxylate reductase [Leptospiraceae bacterium]|nr:pyrroline-5-carboxylate reductase [Leptospiraceae bacterium]
MISSVGVLGTGKMGGTIVQRLLKSRSWTIKAYDAQPDPELTDSGCYVNDIESLLGCDLVLLAVKPADFNVVARNLTGAKAVLSIMAGVPVATISAQIQGLAESAVVRAMPNLGALIGKSTTGVFSLNAALAQECAGLLQAIGSTHVLQKEDDLHAFTALCGSGPAYAFAFIQALAEGAVQSGLPYDQALQLAAEMTLSSSELLLTTREHPSVWRNRVTSPGGTTIAGLARLERGRLHASVMDAIDAATNRSQQLSKS